MRKKTWLVVLVVAILSLPVSNAVADPILDAGWAYDEISAPFVPSTFSPYDFTVTSPTLFSLTDAFIVGDTYLYTDFGAIVGITSYSLYSPFALSDTTADAAWIDLAYKHGQWLLEAGTYQLVVMGDGVGGLPAGFYARLDTVAVPEPSALLLLGGGLLGLVMYGRKRKM